MKPQTHGRPMRKWETTATVQASITQGPTPNRMQTAFSFLNAWEYTHSHSQLKGSWINQQKQFTQLIIEKEAGSETTPLFDILSHPIPGLLCLGLQQGLCSSGRQTTWSQCKLHHSPQGCYATGSPSTACLQSTSKINTIFKTICMTH